MDKSEMRGARILAAVLMLVEHGYNLIQPMGWDGRNLSFDPLSALSLGVLIFFILSSQTRERK